MLTIGLRPGTSRRPKNNAEAMFFDIVLETGSSITKRGWPDFFVETADGQVALVEVKPNSRHVIKHSQHSILRKMARYGVPCFVWSPDVGFTRVLADGRLIGSNLNQVLGIESAPAIVADTRRLRT